MSLSKSHWPLTLLGGAASILNLLLPLIVVRVLPVEQVGEYKIFFLYIVLVPWIALTAGVTNGLSHWAGYSDKRDKAFQNSWSLLCAMSAFVFMILLILRPLIVQKMAWGETESWLFIVGAFVTILAGFFEESSIASGAIWRGALFSSGFELTRGLSILAAAYFFRRIDIVFAAHVAVLSLKLLIGFSMGNKFGFQKFKWDPELIKPIVRYALPVSISAALSIFTGYNDQLILSQALSSADFAIYSLGCLAVPPLQIFEQAVNRVLVPRLSAAFIAKKPEEAKRLLRESSSELSWILIPASVGLSVFAKPIVLLLFTAKFEAAARYLRVFGLAYMNYIFPFDVVARAKGDGKWILKRFVIYSALSFVLIMIGLKINGAMGAMVGSFISQVAMRLISFVEIKTKEKWTFSDMFPFRDWLQYLTATAFAATGGYVMKFIVGDGVIWFFTGGFVFCVIYFFGTFKTFVRRRAEASEIPQVLQLTQYLGLGGLERVILNLSRGLKKDGKWEPTVFVYDALPGAPTLQGEFEKSDIHVIPFVKKPGLSLKAALLIVRVILARKILVIHSHDLGALIYAVLAKWMSLGAVKIVHTQHSFIHLDKGLARYKYYERFFTFFADKVCAVSEGLQKQYEQVGISPSKIAVMTNGVEYPEKPLPSEGELLAARKVLVSEVKDAAARKILEANLEKIWVLCLARVHQKKGQVHVVDVWDTLDQSIRDKAILIFVGQETNAGALDELNAKIAAMKNPPRGSGLAVYAGHTMKPAQWMIASDVFASGSEFEGMPLGPIEAAGSGVEVLVSDIIGHSMLPSFVEKFPLEKKSEGSAKLAKIIEKIAAGRMTVRESGWARGLNSREQFGILAMSRKYEKCYEEVV